MPTPPATPINRRGTYIRQKVVDVEILFTHAGASSLIMMSRCTYLVHAQFLNIYVLYIRENIVLYLFLHSSFNPVESEFTKRK